MDQKNSPQKWDNSTSPDHRFEEPEKRLNNNSWSKMNDDPDEETKTINKSNFDDYRTELDT